MISVVLFILAVLAVGIVQVSLLPTWPQPVASLNLVLSLAVFLAIIVDYRQSLLFTFGTGLFLELFSGLPFGLTTLALLATVIVVNFLFNNFFTNRSFYSLLLLGFIATVLYNLLIFLAVLSLALVRVSDLNLEFNLLTQYVWQPFFNLLVLAIIFVTYYFSTGSLKNIFFTTPKV